MVWSRFSELKKLHGELSYTHRNLFRRLEEFPPFPRAQVFGRFDEAVIEERRNAAEAMFQFTTTIPALYNSPQLKDFFRGGEIIHPLDPTPLSAGPLPSPLIPLPKRCVSDCQPADEEMGCEAPPLTQDIGKNLGLDLGEPEMAAEACNEVGDSPVELPSDTELDDRVPSQVRIQELQETQESFDSLFDSVVEEHIFPQKQGPAHLSDHDFAVFDPCYKQDRSVSVSCCDNSELFTLPADNMNDGGAGYLTAATTELTAAMAKEKEGEFSAAIVKYRTAVDILITGVKGDPDPVRREAMMRKTALYLKHVEMLVDKYSSPRRTHSKQL